MIYLPAEGIEFATIQRFPMGSYPLRKNQPEEIAQFIEDFFDHPEPGEWTKHLRYRYPLPEDSILWLTRANLWIFGGYKKANAEDKEDACLWRKTACEYSAVCMQINMSHLKLCLQWAVPWCGSF